MPQAKGEKLATFGLTEPNAGSDVIGMRSSAKRDGDDWIFREIEVIRTPTDNSTTAGRNQSNINFWQGNIDPTKTWQSTGLVVRRGETIQITASGAIT